MYEKQRRRKEKREQTCQRRRVSGAEVFAGGSCPSCGVHCLESPADLWRNGIREGKKMGLVMDFCMNGIREGKGMELGMQSSSVFLIFCRYSIRMNNLKSIVHGFF